MGIYSIRDILLIIISRGANNCGQHVLEKNIYFTVRFSPHFQLFYFNEMSFFFFFFNERSTMQIYFHSRLCSYLTRVSILVEATVYIYSIYIYIYIYICYFDPFFQDDLPHIVQVWCQAPSFLKSAAGSQVDSDQTLEWAGNHPEAHNDHVAMRIFSDNVVLVLMIHGRGHLWGNCLLGQLLLIYVNLELMHLKPL